MGRRRAPALNPLEDEFVAQLKQQNKIPVTISQYRTYVRRFLRHIGNDPMNATEEQVKDFFKREFGHTNKHSQQRAGVAISQFLKLAVARLPVPVSERGAAMAPASPEPSKKEIALRQQWSVDKLVEAKEQGDDLIAQLARKLIDHYLYFQGRVKGELENLDDVVRFADECRELIEKNLPLFMGLSAGGRNIHTKIDERVQK